MKIRVGDLPCLAESLRLSVVLEGHWCQASPSSPMRALRRVKLITQAVRLAVLPTYFSPSLGSFLTALPGGSRGPR
jgi:hypothetical protein